MTFGIPLGITFLTFYEKRKTHESVCFPIENVVPGHHESIDWGTDFRGVFRVGSKTMFFEILGGSTCRSIQKRTILGPRQERDGAPKSTPASFGGKLFFCIFWQRRGRAKIVKVRSPGVREGRDREKSGLGTRLVYTRLRSRKRHLQQRPASLKACFRDLFIIWGANFDIC